MKNVHNFVLPAGLTVGLLLVPFFGNIFVDGWSWSWFDFVFFGVILFGASLAYELVGKKAKGGVIGGFVTGVVAGFVVIAALRYFNPKEDLAGIAIITLLFSGLIFAILGYFVQNHKKRK